MGKKFYLIHDPRVGVEHLVKSGKLTPEEIEEINQLCIDLAQPPFQTPEAYQSSGASAAEASHKALAQLSLQVDLQSNALAFVNAFWLMGMVVLLLTPLPFLMRRPCPEEAKASAAMH